MSLEKMIKKAAATATIAGTLLFSQPQTAIATDSQNRIDKSDLVAFSINAAVGCALAAIKKDQAWKRCKQGAYAGSIISIGKEIVAKTDVPILGGLIADFGTSKLYNSMKTEGQNDKYTFSYLAARATYTKGNGLKVKLAPEDIIIPIYFAAKGYDFDAKKSLKNGNLIFYDKSPFDLSKNHVNFGLTIGSSTVIRMNNIKAVPTLYSEYNYDVNKQIKATTHHEYVHIIQGRESDLFIKRFGLDGKISHLESKLGNIFDLNDLFGELMLFPIYPIEKKFIELEAEGLVFSPAKHIN